MRSLSLALAALALVALAHQVSLKPLRPQARQEPQHRRSALPGTGAAASTLQKDERRVDRERRNVNQDNRNLAHDRNDMRHESATFNAMNATCSRHGRI